MIHHNDHFIFKIHAHFCGYRIFWCLTVGSTNPDTFTAFHLWGLCLAIIGGFFTREGIYPFLLIPGTYFLFHATVRLCWTLSHLPSLPNKTPKAMSIYQPCTHIQLNVMPSCIYNTKCHCLLSHVTCIMNTIWNNL